MADVPVADTFSPKDDHYDEALDNLFFSLAPLRQTGGFYVEQQWEVLEQVTSCYEQENRYSVFSLAQGGAKDKGSIQFLQAQESTGLCVRLCCGENRGFIFDLKDAETDAKMFRFGRSYRCCGWAAIPGCAHQVNVYNMINEKDSIAKQKTVSYGNSSSKNQIARVRAPFCGGCLLPTFYVETYNPELDKFTLEAKISGNSCWYCPCVVCDCCGASFDVIDKNKQHIAHIDKPPPKNFKDLWLELKTESDKYKVEFDSKEMSFNMKLAILAAVFQIDFNFFEDKRGLQQCHCCDIFCCGYAVACCPLGCLWVCPCCSSSKNKDKGKQQNIGSPVPQVMEV